MLTADIVKVVGVLFGLLVYVMAMTQVASRQAEDEKSISSGTEKAR